MKKLVIGYLSGIFDFYGIEDIEFLEYAKKRCDYLVVGVLSDNEVKKNNIKTLNHIENRLEVIRACKFVDSAIVQNTSDSIEICNKLKANILFVRDEPPAVIKNTFTKIKVVNYHYHKQGVMR